jgi:fluoride exporter
MARLLWVCVGGFLGSGARYGLNGWVAHRFGETFPWGTLTVNVVGSFAVGVLYFACGPDSPVIVSATTRQFVLAGILGGFTTFSTFSIQTLNLLKDGELGAACGNAIGSVVLGLIAAFLGDAVARATWMPR